MENHKYNIHDAEVESYLPSSGWLIQDHPTSHTRSAIKDNLELSNRRAESNEEDVEPIGTAEQRL